jgi:hypothetical protein
MESASDIVAEARQLAAVDLESYGWAHQVQETVMRASDDNLGIMVAARAVLRSVVEEERQRRERLEQEAIAQTAAAADAAAKAAAAAEAEAKADAAAKAAAAAAAAAAAERQRHATYEEQRALAEVSLRPIDREVVKEPSVMERLQRWLKRI